MCKEEWHKTDNVQQITANEKKCSERRKQCALDIEDGAKNFALPQIPFPGA